MAELAEYINPSMDTSFMEIEVREKEKTLIIAQFVCEDQTHTVRRRLGCLRCGLRPPPLPGC